MIGQWKGKVGLDFGERERGRRRERQEDRGDREERGRQRKRRWTEAREEPLGLEKSQVANDLIAQE